MKGLDPLWGAFWVGIASGLVTAFVIFIFRRAIGQLLSLLLGMFSRRVRGTWKTNFLKTGKSYEELAHVYQLFNRVWGIIYYPSKARTYRFRGIMHSNILVATYENKGDRNTIDCGAFTLFIDKPGKVMTGKYAWTDDLMSEPQADTYEWRIS